MEDSEFEHIARHMRPVLMRIGRKVLVGADDAEDVAQEALLRLWLLREHIHSAEEAEKLAARIARNYSISLWRKRSNREANLDDLPEPLTSASPDRMMEEQENARLLLEAMEHLPIAYQRILRLNVETDMNAPQIAAVTGIALRSVTVMLSTARKQVIDELKKKNRL